MSSGLEGAPEPSGAVESPSESSAEGRERPDELPRSLGRARVHGAMIAGLVVLVALAFSDVLGAARGLFYCDHLLTFRPRFFAISEAIRSGAWPGAPGRLAGGVPLEILLNGTFTPPLALFFFGEFEVVYDLYVIAHAVILGAGAYVLATQLGCRPFEALAAAATSALAGPVLSFENLLVGLSGFAFGVWVYVGFFACLRAPSLSRTALLALALGFHFQGIMPVGLVIDLAAMSAILAHVRPAIGGRLVAHLALALVLGLMIASIQLGPVLEALPHSRRGRGFSLAEASQWSMHPWMFVELIAPSFWAPPDMPFAAIRALNDGQSSPYLNSLYLGASLPIAAAALLRERSRGLALLLWGGFVLGVLVSLGHHAPLHRYLVQLPLMSSERFPVKYMVLATACLAALVPLGLRAAEERPRLVLLLAGAHLAVVLGLGSVVRSEELEVYLAGALSRDLPVPAFIGVDPSTYPALLRDAMGARVLHSTCFSALGLLVLVGLAFRPHGSRSALPLAVVLGLDLGLAGAFSVPGAETDAAPPPNVQALLAGTPKVMGLGSGARRAAVAHRPGHTFFEDLVRSERTRGYLFYRGEVRAFQDRDPDGYSNPLSVRTSAALNGLPEPMALRLLARAGVGWITTPWEPTQPGALRFEVEDEAPQYIFPVPESRPLLSAYPRWTKVPRAELLDPRTFLSWILRPEHWETALVIEDSAGELPLASGGEACGEAPTVELLEPWRPGVYRGRVTGACPSLLVASEPYFPGWKAQVDGQETPVVEAELGFFGALVPAGTHEVTLEYELRTPFWAPFSLGALLLTLALGALGRIRERSAGLRP